MDSIRRIVVDRDDDYVDTMWRRTLRCTRKRLFDVRIKNGQYEARLGSFFEPPDNADTSYKILIVSCLLFLWDAYPFLDTPRDFYSEIFERDLDEIEMHRLEIVRHNLYEPLLQICFLFHSIDFDTFAANLKSAFLRCR